MFLHSLKYLAKLKMPDSETHVNAVIFAQVIGPLFLAISTLMIMHNHIITSSVQEVIDHAELRLTASLSPLLIGLTILLTSEPVILRGDYLVYAIGFIFLASGLFRLFFTSVWLRLMTNIGNDAYTQVISYALLSYGVLLTYHGYYNIL